MEAGTIIQWMAMYKQVKSVPGLNNTSGLENRRRVNFSTGNNTSWTNTSTQKSNKLFHRRLKWRDDEPRVRDHAAGMVAAANHIFPTITSRFEYIFELQANNQSKSLWIYSVDNFSVDFRYRRQYETPPVGWYKLGLNNGARNRIDYIFFNSVAFMQGFIRMSKACGIDFRDIISGVTDSGGKRMELPGYNLSGKFPNPEYEVQQLVPDRIKDTNIVENRYANDPNDGYDVEQINDEITDINLMDKDDDEELDIEDDLVDGDAGFGNRDDLKNMGYPYPDDLDQSETFMIEPLIELTNQVILEDLAANA